MSFSHVRARCCLTFLRVGSAGLAPQRVPFPVLSFYYLPVSRHTSTLPYSSFSSRSLASSSSSSPFPPTVAHFQHPLRHFSGPSIKTTDTDTDTFHQEGDRALELIIDRLESDDIDSKFRDLEIQGGGDVLTIKKGGGSNGSFRGTWVLNKHSVTRQIWLSSPISGPSKYNWHGQNRRRWLGERDEQPLMDLLQREFTKAFTMPIRFDETF